MRGDERPRVPMAQPPGVVEGASVRALVLVENGVLEHQEVPLPPRPDADWALVEVAYAGICQSDLERGFGDGAYHYPLIMGHEISGVVVEPADSGTPPAGTRVAVSPLLPCRRCAACERQDYAKCSDYDYLGSRRDGGFAERLWVPGRNLYPVPAQLDLKSAALVEPAAVALHGASLLELQGVEIALVIGDGPLGIMLAQWLRHRGCPRVIVSGAHAAKLDLCAELGFETIRGPGEGLPQRLQALTDGRTVGLVAEAVGSQEAILQALGCGGSNGQVLLLGNPRGDLVIPRALYSSLLRRELVLRGAWNSRLGPPERDQWRQTLAELGRGLVVDRLISHVYPLAQGVEVFRRLRAREEGHAKVLFEVGG